MNYCYFDWNLASKFIPFITSLITIIIALFVYHYWHKQKAKEVMANEAKQCIKDLLEMIKIINYFKVGKYKIVQEQELEFSKFKVLFEQTIINIMYIDDCVKIKNLRENKFDFSKAGNAFIKLKSNNSADFDNSKFLSQLDEHVQEFGVKGMNIVNLLKPYSLYRETFKFKD